MILLGLVSVFFKDDLKDKGGSLTARNLTRMGGGTKGKDASRAALSAHSKTQFCACARASLQRRTLIAFGFLVGLQISKIYMSVLWSLLH
jgi:hypothetical protein